MIKIEKMTKIYRAEEVETTALNQVDLQIEEGEFVAVMGPSGCGKSTLLNILGLLTPPSAGEFSFMGHPIQGRGERERSRLRKANIGFVFQNFNLIDELSVFENVALALQYLGVNGKERKQRVEEILEQMGMAHRRNHLPQQLSGGQQQRTAVARAVVGRPKLILADEPTGNLDSTTGNEVMKLLTDLNDAGTTIVMVTHSQIDASFSHRKVRLFDGRIVSEQFQEDQIHVA